MSATEQSLIEYLRKKANGIVMTPQQLAQEIPISAKQQSVLRQQKVFPIPHKNIGKNIFYSIYHIADFLLSGEVNQTKKVELDTHKVKSKTVRHEDGTLDYSHRFNLRGFVSHLQDEAQNLSNFANAMVKFEQSFLLKEKLEKDLPVKNLPRKKDAI